MISFNNVSLQKLQANQVYLKSYLLMIELSEQKVWEVTKLLYNQFRHEQSSQKLDAEHLDQFKKQYVKPLYPHKMSQDGKIQKYSCKDSCCIVTPGSFCCCKTTKPDASFRKLGLGICLYFKFLKHASGVFLLMSILAIFSCLICIWVSVQNGFNITQTYSNFLYSTTLGTFASQRKKCSYSKIGVGINPLYPYTASINLTCPHGRINYFGAVYSNQSSDTLFNCRAQAEKLNTLQALTSSFTNNITQSNSCSTASSSCSVSFELSNNYYNSSTVAFGYECLEQTYSLGSQIKSQNLFYTIISVDLFCCLVIMLFYISQEKAEQEQVKFFKGQQLSLNDFSLKIQGFNLATYQRQLDYLIKSISKTLGEQSLKQILQIKLPDKLDFIEYQNSKETVYKQLYDFMVQEFFDREINPSGYRSANEFKDRNFPTSQSYQKFKQKLVKYVDQYNILVYQPEQVTDKFAKVSIYIVFCTIRMKKKVYQLQEDGCFSRFLKVQSKEYNVAQPPAPDLIVWQNKGKKQVPRNLISWLITLVISFGSYVLFGYIQAKQNSILSEFNFNINCKILFQTSQLITYNTTLSSSDSNYLNCFCEQNIFSFDNPDVDKCGSWRVKYVTYLSIPIIISLLLVVYNVVVSFIFRKLTVFQAHRLITNELFSFTIKRAFLLIMNMGLIIILLNTQFQKNVNIQDLTSFNFLIQGKYNDITADWYINIGTIIILTMIFNISFPLIELLLASILKCFKKCWDKKFCIRKTSCKTKNQYVQLFQDDIYPIQERYAFLIAIFMITLAFSCVIPILYIICAISVFLLFLADKLLIFKLYQTPINYNADLHQLIKKAIYVGLVAHMALSAVFLSQEQLVASNSSFSEGKKFSSGNSRIDAMINTYYIIPYVILFLALTGWAIFDNTIIALCNKCTLLCKKSLSNMTKYKLQQDYFQSINHYQLTKLKRITENELHKITIKNQNLRNFASRDGNQSGSINPNFDETMKTFNSSSYYQPTQHQGILRRTLARIREEQYRKRMERDPKDIFMIGMPGYQMMLNDQAFDINKKNVALTEGLNFILKDVNLFLENPRAMPSPKLR